MGDVSRSPQWPLFRVTSVDENCAPLFLAFGPENLYARPSIGADSAPFRCAFTSIFQRGWRNWSRRRTIFWNKKSHCGVEDPRNGGPAKDLWRVPFRDRRFRYCMIFLCEDGGTGRRARFRIWWGDPWGFKSPSSHQATGGDGAIGRGDSSRRTSPPMLPIAPSPFRRSPRERVCP